MNCEKPMHVEVLNKIFGEFDFLMDAFTPKELKNCFLLIFSICFAPKKTISSMGEWLEGINQCTLNRFVSGLDTEVIFQKTHEKLKENTTDKVVKLLIDDTKIEKTGEHIEKTGIEKDHSKKTYLRCFSVVFSILKIDGFDLPLPFAAENCMKKKNKKDKRKKSKITIAMKMIDVFATITKTAAKRIVLFDSWYCATRLIHSIPKGIFWATRLKFKDSRLVWLNDCWLPIWKFYGGVNSWNFKRTKIGDKYYWTYCTELKIHKLGNVTVVLSKTSRYSRKLQIFIGNMKTAQEVLENYDERWDIEVFFRSIKQDFGIGEIQARKYCGNRGYWTMVLLAYSAISFLQRLWRTTCKTAGETLNRLEKLLKKSAPDYGRSLGGLIFFYVSRNFAKV